mgnify:CR=1 FL=1
MNKRITAIILMVATFLTSSYAATTAYKKNITVEAGTRVEFNNQSLDMKDVNGKSVDAFIYQGTTYVPVRAVSNAFGADISYDDKTNIVSVYDDFNEIVTVAYKLNHAMYYCLSSCDLWIDNIFAGVAYDPSEEMNLQTQLISRNSRMIKTISEDNGNYGYLSEKLVPLYIDFVNQYDSARSMYYVYSKNTQNTSALTSMVNYKGKMLNDYIEYSNEMEDLLDSFNWRDFK